MSLYSQKACGKISGRVLPDSHIPFKLVGFLTASVKSSLEPFGLYDFHMVIHIAYSQPLPSHSTVSISGQSTPDMSFYQFHVALKIEETSSKNNDISIELFLLLLDWNLWRWARNRYNIIDFITPSRIVIKYITI